MDFTLATWKQAAADKLQAIGGWLDRRRRQDAPYLLYGTLCGLSLWPLIEAAQAGQFLPVIMALGSVAGGVGGNLLAEQVQRWKDRAGEVDEAEVADWAADQAAADPELRQALDAILEKMEAIPQAQAALATEGRDSRAWFVETLRAEMVRLGSQVHLEAKVTGSGAIAQGPSAQAAGERAVVAGQVDGSIATGDGSISVGGHVIHAEQGATVNIGPPPAAPCAVDEATALPCYLERVIEDNRRLQLQGIRSASGLVSIDLEEIYVTLTATVRRTVQDEQAWVEEMAGLAPGEAKRAGLDRPRERVQQVKVAVQEALAAHPRLVVLGDPGCGKTTLLRYLALTYARDRQAPGPVHERLRLDEHRLPVLLPLRDLARYLDKEHPDIGADGPKLLLDYLRIYFQNQQLPLPPDFFESRLKAGECAVLFDGVDEVASMATRQRVARLVERFTLAYPRNRYVITSRIVGYTAGARLGADYAVTTVRDFTDADIERFVRHWNRAVEVVLAGGATQRALREAEKQAGILLAAIRGNERVRELAVNPLLLTVIALVQRYRAALPERRVELYEEAIEVLLVQWDAVKGLSATAVLQGLELDAGDRRALLEPVALWMMEQRAREIDLDDLRRQLAKPFHALLRDERLADKAVDGFVQLIDERSGLLAQRGQGVYAFSHLTFQEHLAARAVADRADYVPYTLARLGDSWWREVMLLEAGYLSTQGKRRATELVRAIMDCREEPEPTHNLVLAAEAVRDVGQARLEGDLAGEIQGRLRQTFETPLRKKAGDLAALVRSRAAAAEALARIEGGTFGAQPAFWRLPHGEPVWVEIPAGEFWMGGEMYDAEKPVHRVHLERFWIARVPITNAQYQLFVEATACRAPDHWENGRPPKGKDSHPVVNVSWHDALAYCRWLSEATGKHITLPSEAEWEKAARGDRDRRAYPWGEAFEATRCNSHELDLGDTTPVGIFPEGASPYGVLDMSGNVWEWTRSNYKDYPYNPDDGREDLEAGDENFRVLRGGAFFYYQDFVRCACRSGYYPVYRSGDYGMRVVVVPV